MNGYTVDEEDYFVSDFIIFEISNQVPVKHIGESMTKKGYLFPVSLLSLLLLHFLRF